MRKGGEEEKGSEGSDGGMVNCVYSAAMEKSMLFFCLLAEIFSWSGGFSISNQPTN